MSPVLAYLICPVRRATKTQLMEMQLYVEQLEAAGTHLFHYPPRDVNQANDDGGVRICLEHTAAMCRCDEIHVWLDEDGGLSEGSMFDLGMAYMLNHRRKGIKDLRFVIANGPIPPQSEKSFLNVLRRLADE